MFLCSRRCGDQALRGAVLALLWLLPQTALAENRDGAEIAHAIWFIGIFSLFFFSVMSFAIWLLIVRLRSGPPSLPEHPAPLHSLEKVWSKEARAAGSPAPAVERQDS